MFSVIVSFILGMVVMDFMWAYKMGIPQAMWRRWKNRKTRI
jgi:hypothetical protein